MKQSKPFPLRMPDEMRDFFELAAKENNRSLNAEILIHLQAVMKLKTLEKNASKAISSSFGQAESSIKKIYLDKKALDFVEKIRELDDIVQRLERMSKK